MPRFVDLSGQRFGKRIVVCRVFKVKGRVHWKVKCDCGHEMVCLGQGVKKSKRCEYCAYKGPRPYRRHRPYEALYNTFVQRARYRVFITYEEFLPFTEVVTCHYCNAPINWQPYKGTARSSASNLDRKDSHLPYVLDNVVVCCIRCNKAKNTHFTYEEWKLLGQVIQSWRILAELELTLEQEQK